MSHLPNLQKNLFNDNHKLWQEYRKTYHTLLVKKAIYPPDSRQFGS